MKTSIRALVFFCSVFFIPHTLVYGPSVPLETQLTELREYVARMIEARNTLPLTDTELRDGIKMGTNWLTDVQVKKLI